MAASLVMRNLDRLTSNKFLRILSVFTTFTLVRSWSGGYRYALDESRNITDRVFILVGALSGPGLSVLTSLAERGAQLIVLHPSPSDPAVLELILLLRATSNNERIYAEECDITDLKSIKAFAKKWGTDARKGMVGDLEAMIEGIVFCEGAGAGLEGVGIGVPKQLVYFSGVADTPTTEVQNASLVLGRHALIQLLLPFLTRSSQIRHARIVFQISPFYAASPMLLPDPLAALEFTPPQHYPRLAPWVAEGQASLASLALLRELQARVDTARKEDAPGIVCLAACGGFTRAWFRRSLRATKDHPSFSWLGFLVYLLLWPVLFMVTKSAEQASQDLLLAILGKVEEKEAPLLASGAGSKGHDAAKIRREEVNPRKTVRRGQLLREGVATRVMGLENAGPTLGPKLWEAESRVVAESMGLVAAKEKEEKAAKASASS